MRYYAYDTRKWSKQPNQSESDDLGVILSTVALWIQEEGIQRKYIEIYEKISDTEWRKIYWDVSVKVVA